ncbi:hypothetical protein ABEB36_015850 [Hypothenemus hampei]|uniref:Uncharacterized protein n=1 Tax=Hypothenemus hampei TaxID=57062 RepID=A0ABD1DYJ9_HYPHA
MTTRPIANKGKPEKPERSKEGIHSRFVIGGERNCVTKIACGFAPSFLRTDYERVHFSSGRTSRSVGCRFKVHGGARFAYVSNGPVFSRPTRSTVYERFKAARLERSTRGKRVSFVSKFGPSADPDRWRLLVAKILEQTLLTDRRRYRFGYFQDPS